jgi:hypothetical protein
LNAFNIFKGHDKDRVDALIDAALEGLNEQDPSIQYAKFHHLAMVGVLIVAFCKNSIKNWIKNIHSSKVRTGMGGNTGNKGAVILWFELDDTSVVLANSHLESG